LALFLNLLWERRIFLIIGSVSPQTFHFAYYSLQKSMRTLLNTLSLGWSPKVITPNEATLLLKSESN
jgi:hypothetical protein